MKYIYLILLCVLTLNLTSCYRIIARHINASENIADIEYPPAFTSYPELKNAADIKLDKYKSIQTRINQNKNFAIALAVSGGGYRSANLALGVMLELEKIQHKALKQNLLQEVDYFSTVSGGGLAVGFYLSRLHNFITNDTHIKHFSLQAEIDKILLNDAIKPNPLRADLMNYLFSNDEKEGFQVEKILNDTLLSTTQGGLVEGDIFIPANSKKTVRLPYWAINTTIYQNASIMPFTPDVLNTYKIEGYYHNHHFYYFPNQTNPSFAYNIPVSVGLMASLSVPLALPPTKLVSHACKNGPCYLQLYDGGIADNLGINTALNLLLQDKREIKILMVIDSGKDLLQPFSKLKQSPDGMPLMVRLTTISTDAYRKYIKSHLNFIANKILCSKETNHVIVIYFDLEGYPATQQIRSDLKLSLKDQRTLLKIGKELVKKDKALNGFLAELAQGKITMGQCNRL